MSLLLIVLFLPLAGFFVLQFLPKESKAAWFTALVFSIAAFLVSLGLIAPVAESPTQQSSIVDTLWVASANIHFHLAVDGINIWLVLLTTLLLPIGIWVSDTLVKDRKKTFYALLLLFEF